MLKPRDIAKKLGKALKRDRVRLVHKILVPNHVVVWLPSEFLEQWRPLLGQLEMEFKGHLQTSVAKLSGTELIGPVRVSLQEDSGLGPSQVHVETSFIRGQLGGARLVALRGLSDGQTFPLLKTVTTLGRGEVDLRLPEQCQGVSRIHAHIVANEHGYLIEDLGSRSGTFVNAQEVKQRELIVGDRICLGEVELRFEVDA